MELKKVNLHMDRIKCRINTQITLEEDKNISDRCPDVINILMENGKVIIDEVRPMTDNVLLRGKFQYEVLCESDMTEKRLFRLQGEIPWEEKIKVEGMESMDVPQVFATIEDIKSSLINSRKLNIRTLLNFCITGKELYDEEILVDVQGSEEIEIKKEGGEVSCLAVDKKDIYRIKEDLELPSFLPPIGEVLWKYVDLGKVEVKILEDSLRLQGEVHFFLLYESEGDVFQIKSYEATIPFSGNIECNGCSSNMIGNMIPVVTYQNLSVKEDYDGEDRMLELEMVLEIPIQLYEKKMLEEVVDVYGVSREIVATYKEENSKKMKEPYFERCKVTKELKIKNTDKKILQVCHMNAQVGIEETRRMEEGVEIQGRLQVCILYLVDGEEETYDVMKKEIPFVCEIDNLKLDTNCSWHVHPMIEQQNVGIVDENSIEIKMVIGLEVWVEERCVKNRIQEITFASLEADSAETGAGIVVYIPTKQEPLWEIGKRYGISLKTIKAVNTALEVDESTLSHTKVEKGEKLILVRG